MKEMSFAFKKKPLKGHEARKIMEGNEYANFKETFEATNTIEPVGEKMKEKLRQQTATEE